MIVYVFLSIGFGFAIAMCTKRICFNRNALKDIEKLEKRLERAMNELRAFDRAILSNYDSISIDSEAPQRMRDKEEQMELKMRVQSVIFKLIIELAGGDSILRDSNQDLENNSAKSEPIFDTIFR